VLIGAFHRQKNGDQSNHSSCHSSVPVSPVEISLLNLMKRLLASLLVASSALHAVDLSLTTPLDYQGRAARVARKGLLRIAGELSELVSLPDVAVEARVLGEKDETSWQRVGGSVSGKRLSGTVEAPAGGWWRLEVRVSQSGRQLAHGSVAHVGIGEVFVVAGQSNSANHGAEKQTTKTRRVASFDGKAWRIADDPQPGASGGGGSFVPRFARMRWWRMDVPVGIIACGIGATSVREWLPKGATFPNPPTHRRVACEDSCRWPMGEQRRGV